MTVRTHERRRPFAWARRSASFAMLACLALCSIRQARAWDPATTHAGLTERALAASQFHVTLVRQLGRGLGGFEPLKLDTSLLAPDVARGLTAQLGLLDPAGGYRPNQDGMAPAFAWVKAGAVLAKTPPERGRNHFVEPRTRAGLEDDSGLAGTMHAARLTMADSTTVRETATGQTFALEGMSALDWLVSARNELGLPVFFEQWEAAATAGRPNARDAALVRALLALGGVLSVLEDAGQPAFVRNDFRGEFLGPDDGSAFERFVADRYGQVALPKSIPPVARPDWQSYFVAADGKGLAQTTQRSFFSAGTLPSDVSCDDDTTGDVVRLANQSLRFPEPRLTSLALRSVGGNRYVTWDGVRILAYERTGHGVRFSLDQAVFADVSQRWLPEVAGYAAGLVDHLLRAKVSIAIEGKSASISVASARGPLAADAHLRVLVDDAHGERREIFTAELGAREKTIVDLPSGARKIVAVVRGRDQAGEVVAAGEAALP